MSSNDRCDSAFKRALLHKCYEALEAAGFTRYRKEGVDWPMENGFHCWVGLNTALEREYVEINPFVGVHVVPIMKLYTDLENRRYDRSIATYSIHMGELKPDEQAFRFTRQTDLDVEAKRLARLYVDAGLSYALSIGSYDRLLPLLMARVSMLGSYPERVASCLYLMGRKEDARSFAEEFVRQKPDYFGGFADQFLKMLTH